MIIDVIVFLLKSPIRYEFMIFLATRPSSFISLVRLHLQFRCDFLLMDVNEWMSSHEGT